MRKRVGRKNSKCWVFLFVFAFVFAALRLERRWSGEREGGAWGIRERVGPECRGGVYARMDKTLTPTWMNLHT